MSYLSIVLEKMAKFFMGLIFLTRQVFSDVQFLQDNKLHYTIPHVQDNIYQKLLKSVGSVSETRTSNIHNMYR